MVVLRIWYPLRPDGPNPGFASLYVSSAKRAAYMSVRPVKDTANRGPEAMTATLADDVKAEGRDTPYLWTYTRMDEARILRAWDQFKGPLALHSKTRKRENSFRVCDMLLAIGRGHEIEPTATGTLTDQAEAPIRFAALAINRIALSANAERYLKFEHW